MTPDLFTSPIDDARAFLAGLPALPQWCKLDKLALVLHLDEESPSNNVIKGQHFHTYRKTRKNWAAKVAHALGDQAPPQLQRAALFVVRRCAGSGLDWDNAYGGLKPILDCMVAPKPANPDGLYIFEDDGPKNMPFPPGFAQLPGKRGAGSTEIYVFAL